MFLRVHIHLKNKPKNRAKARTMMNSKMQVFSSILVLVLITVFSSTRIEAQLQVGFYNSTCPSAESIVREEVKRAFGSNTGIAAGLVRMHFHDCFVRGCDGSVLIDSTPNNSAEKDGPANSPSLRGFEVIDSAKKRIEAKCKGIVSCADILAFAARDSVKITKGLFYDVPSGRRDGRTSLLTDTFANLPAPFLNVDQLTQSFASKGLSQEEMVILSGAHTIGRSHCTTLTQIDNRLYNVSGTNAPDPTLLPAYASQLQQACPLVSNDTTTTVPMDPDTPVVTDNKYYSNIVANKGLFTSDHALLTNTVTTGLVKQYSKDKLLWLNKFSAAMVKMGNIEVLTGAVGEIRIQCRVIN